MTPQFILRMSLCREPHCSSRGTREQQVRAALSEVENLGFAKEYAERGYTDPEKGILFADWNHFPRGIDSLLEGYGYAMEWSDEWATCGNCYRAVRTQPDGWDWRPFFTLGDGEITCTDCLRDAGEPLPGEETTVRLPVIGTGRRGTGIPPVTARRFPSFHVVANDCSMFGSLPREAMHTLIAQQTSCYQTMRARQALQTH